MHEGTMGRRCLVTRVEDWECDFNKHWNTQFYGGAFDAAAQVAAYGLSGAHNSNARTWHVRFHRELRSGASVEVFSSTAPQSGADDASLHVLCGDGALAATALSWPPVASLPLASSDTIARANPRGLGAAPNWTLVQKAPHHVAPMGYLGESDWDSDRRLRLQAMLRLCGRASHAFTTALGFRVNDARIGRMLVELRTTLFPMDAAPAPMMMSSRLTEIGEKHFLISSILGLDNTAPLAHIELCLLAVDLDTRRAAPVPHFVRAAVSD